MNAANVKVKEFEDRAIEAEGYIASLRSASSSFLASRSTAATASSGVTPPSKKSSNAPSMARTGRLTNLSTVVNEHTAALSATENLSASPEQGAPNQAVVEVPANSLSMTVQQEPSVQDIEATVMDEVCAMVFNESPPPGKKKRKEDNKWTREECVKFFREQGQRSHYGKNDWTEIAKLIPGKGNGDLARKWKGAKATKTFNALERACVDEKVASEPVPGTVLYGTITGYKMDQETHEGTWTVTYDDGQVGKMNKRQVLAAMNLHDEKTASVSQNGT